MADALDSLRASTPKPGTPLLLAAVREKPVVHLDRHVTRGPFYESEAAGRYLTGSLFVKGARETWRDAVLRATEEDR